MLILRIAATLAAAIVLLPSTVKWKGQDALFKGYSVKSLLQIDLLLLSGVCRQMQGT